MKTPTAAAWGSYLLEHQHGTKIMGVFVSITRFGETGVRFANPALNPDENFSSKILTDLSLSYTPKSWLTIASGANNIFNGCILILFKIPGTHRKDH